MFRVVHGIQEIHFAFRHNAPDFQLGLFEIWQPGMYGTDCYASVGAVNSLDKDKVLIADGHARLKGCDEYDPEYGRRRALTSALRVMKADRDLRTKVWKEYFRNTANPININTIRRLNRALSSGLVKIEDGKLVRQPVRKVR